MKTRSSVLNALPRAMACAIVVGVLTTAGSYYVPSNKTSRGTIVEMARILATPHPEDERFGTAEGADYRFLPQPRKIEILEQIQLENARAESAAQTFGVIERQVRKEKTNAVTRLRKASSSMSAVPKKITEFIVGLFN